LKDAATRKRIIGSDDPAYIHSQLITSES